MVEYLYTSAVQGATAGSFSVAKVQSAVQAANFFGMPKMAFDCQAWAAARGAELPEVQES